MEEVNRKAEIRLLFKKPKIGSISLATGFRMNFFVIFTKEIT